MSHSVITFRSGSEGPMARKDFVIARATVMLAAALFVLSPALISRAQQQAQGNDGDSKAIKQVFAEFYESFSRHDAHAAAMTFAEDADFTNMGGNHDHGRKAIEDHLARLFTGNLKDARRTDIVKNIRFISPEVADVDADTVITGTKAADGSGVPSRQVHLRNTTTTHNRR